MISFSNLEISICALLCCVVKKYYNYHICQENNAKLSSFAFIEIYNILFYSFENLIGLNNFVKSKL